MNLRIKEYEQGFLVEIQKTKWYGKKYWTFYSHYFGDKDSPFYYSTYEQALEFTLKEIKWKITDNSFN